MSLRRWRSLLLPLVVVVLAGLWWWTGRTSKVAVQRTYAAQLLVIDTALLQELVIRPASNRHHPDLHLERTGGAWTLNSGGHQVQVDDRDMRDLLVLLADLRTARVLGERASLHPSYGLMDTAANMLVLPTDAGPRELLVGRSIASNEDGVSTAVCFADEQQAYTVYGDLFSPTERSFPDWVPKPMVNGDPRHWVRLTFLFPDRSYYSLEQRAGEWWIGDVRTDQERTWKYINNLALYRGNAVVDPSDTLGAVPGYRIEVIDTTRQAPVTLTIYQARGRLIARSSLAPPYLVMPFDQEVELPRMFRPPGAFLPGHAVNNGS